MIHCKPCEDAERAAQKNQEAINKVKEIARHHAKKKGYKIIEIVRLINGSYSWKPIGVQHRHEIVEYLYND